MVRPGQASNYSFFRSYAFDVSVLIQLDSSNYASASAVEVPSATVESRARSSAHANGSRIALGDRLVEPPGALDRTVEFRQSPRAARLRLTSLLADDVDVAPTTRQSRAASA